MKRKSAQKMKELNAEKIEKEREEKRLVREQKSQDRIAHDRAIMKCACGGSYQNYQKKRHEESKKHLTFINS
jgi:hypothetical protein